MYLFVRRARLAGGQTRASMMWATEITERVNQVTGLGVSLHAQVFSAEVGELVWATMVPDLSTLETGFEKLEVDDFYVAEQDRAHGFMTGPPSDVVQSLVHGTPADHGPGSYTTAITATCAPGRITEAVTNAIALADKAMTITGSETTVSISQTGPYGGITWSTAFPGIASLDAAQEALNSDPGWLAFVDRMTADVYTSDPMASAQAMYRRIL
jgi:hypothetical protein